MEGTLADERLFKTVEAGETLSRETGQLGNHQAGCSADGRHGAAAGPVILQDFHEFGVFCEVLAAGHAAGENHEVGAVRSGFHYFEVVPGYVGRDLQPVGALYQIFVRDGHGDNRDAAAKQHIPRSQGFHILEAISQKNVYSFHRLLLKKSNMSAAHSSWRTPPVVSVRG